MDDEISVGLTPKKKAELKQMMGKYSGKADLSLLNEMNRDEDEMPSVKDRLIQALEEMNDMRLGISPKKSWNSYIKEQKEIDESIKGDNSESVSNDHEYYFYDMIFDKEKREAVYKYYDDIYVETEEEKEIFRVMSSRRKKD